MRKPQRIMLFGRPGSGKSTVALRLSKQFNIPVYHLDRYFYVANWVERNYEQFMQDQYELVSKERWIIDGNCTSSLDVRYARADIAIYFYYPAYVCLWRMFKRTWSKDKAIDDRAQGCSETINWKLIKYMWSFDKRVANKLKLLQERYPHVTFYKITNGRELAQVLKDLED